MWGRNSRLKTKLAAATEKITEVLCQSQTKNQVFNQIISKTNEKAKKKIKKTELLQREAEKKVISMKNAKSTGLGVLAQAKMAF